MFISTVAVLDASVPVLLLPTALTGEPFAGFTVTVMSVFNGMFEQCTTMGIGLACWAAMIESGLASTPLGDKLTDMPATL